MKKAPLLEAVLDYKEENNLILSMPGNKSGKAFLRDRLGGKFRNTLGELDITEVDPLDNLHSPEGVIKEAEDLLAKAYKVKRGYFVVNGSTASNLAAIFSAFNEGDEVLVERNCHKSVYNGLILRKLKPIYIDAVIDKEIGIFMPPSKEEIIKALGIAKNPKGIILTNPNYYGIYYEDISIFKDLKEKGLKIIIDAAHGAHYGFANNLPKSIAVLGDYVILSPHKTLPALTQGGYLLSNVEDDNLNFYIRAFMTTSPSYLIMSSLDYARYYLDNYAEEDYKALIEKAEEYRIKINKLNKVSIISQDNIKEGYGIDKSRYLMTLNNGYSGHKLLEYLRSRKIQAEMSFTKGVVLILSPSNTKEDFIKLYDAINKLEMENIKAGGKDLIFNSIINEKILEPHEVFNLKGELVSLKDAANKIAMEAIVPYPPGIPLVLPGERISEKSINIINDYINNKLSVIGVENRFIKVILD